MNRLRPCLSAVATGPNARFQGRPPAAALGRIRGWKKGLRSRKARHRRARREGEGSRCRSSIGPQRRLGMRPAKTGRRVQVEPAVGAAWQTAVREGCSPLRADRHGQRSQLLIFAATPAEGRIATLKLGQGNLAFGCVQVVAGSRPMERRRFRHRRSVSTLLQDRPAPARLRT